MIHAIHIICFVALIALALFAFIPKIRPEGIDLTAAALAVIGIAYTAGLALARVFVLLIVCTFLLTGCKISEASVEYNHREQAARVGVKFPVYDGKTALR